LGKERPDESLVVTPETPEAFPGENIMIQFLTGNILAADVEAVVNPANAHGVMGAGLALQFRNKCPRMFAEYKRRCAAGEFGPGEVMPVKVADYNPQWVLNFATKDHWRDPSKLEYIERGLVELRWAILSLEMASGNSTGRRSARGSRLLPRRCRRSE
jgi:hypothetical protein